MASSSPSICSTISFCLSSGAALFHTGLPEQSPTASLFLPAYECLRVAFASCTANETNSCNFASQASNTSVLTFKNLNPSEHFPYSGTLPRHWGTILGHIIKPASLSSQALKLKPFPWLAGQLESLQENSLRHLLVEFKPIKRDSQTWSWTRGSGVHYLSVWLHEGGSSGPDWQLAASLCPGAHCRNGRSSATSGPLWQTALFFSVVWPNMSHGEKNN